MEDYAIVRCTGKNAIKHLTLNTTWNMLISAFVLTTWRVPEQFSSSRKKRPNMNPFRNNNWFYDSHCLTFWTSSTKHFRGFFRFVIHCYWCFHNRRTKYAWIISKLFYFSLWTWHVEIKYWISTECTTRIISLQNWDVVRVNAVWHDADWVKLMLIFICDGDETWDWWINKLRWLRVAVYYEYTYTLARNEITGKFAN